MPVLKISRDSLNDRITQRTQELDMISGVALIISRAGSPEDVLDEALEKVVNVAGAAGGIIQLFEDGDTWLAAHVGLPGTIIDCFNHVQYDEGYLREIQYTIDGLQVTEIEPEVCRKIFPREYQVLELVAQGLTNKEIAVRLVISENTVSSHLRCILDKLHMNNRVQAALWLQEQKTISSK